MEIQVIFNILTCNNLNSIISKKSTLFIILRHLSCIGEHLQSLGQLFMVNFHQFAIYRHSVLIHKYFPIW
jgi:hypothetical protein